MNPGITNTFISNVYTRTARPLTAFLAVVVALLIALTASPGPANAQSTPNEITGRVIQGTSGAEIPSDLEVLLLIVDEAQQTVIATESMIVGPDGEFSFSDFQTGEGITYRVVADNGKHTPSVDLSPDESSFTDIEITIYESTSSFEDIRISTYSMLVPSIDRVDRLIGVLSVISLVNSGDNVWIAPDIDNPDFPVTGLDLLRFNLPEGFTELSVESNLPPGNILEISSGFALTTPVPPGEYDILVTYIAEYSGDSLEFPLRLPYGADQVRIFLPEGEGTITGEGLGEPEGTFIDEDPYISVTGTNYERDAQLDVVFSELPTPSLVERIQTFFDGRGYVIVIAWVAGAVMLGLLAYAFFFAKQRDREPVPVAASANGYPEYEGLDRTDIVEAIAELDEQHAKGQIDDDDYTARRETLTQAALITKDQAT